MPRYFHSSIHILNTDIISAGACVIEQRKITLSWTPGIVQVNFFVARIAKNLTNELCDEVGEKSVFFRLTIKRLCRLYIRRPGMTIVARSIEDSAAIFQLQ